ncbi:MAG: thioredoxin-disulfide reductase [Bacteroidales bacterium]|jgi:thioredoxin reductase (NADPH)|nr:thioredoxin-disulfide reductase [Bacteroidales bacterium]MDY0315718.1 thioredoxin-disulfide reductase [Bacteroidales bacterium]NLB86727.1 thioredoxin-disulfide reductase [Bacteroidales bacterium]
MEKIYDIAIIGGGPAGLSAAIYSSRAKLKTVILNEGSFGGQVVMTNEVANYPGVDLTKGYSLANTMKKQAKDFGTKLVGNIKIKNYDIQSRIKTFELEDGRVFKAKAVIYAVGGRPRSINAIGEDEFKGAGVSYCATCDGDFFTGKEVIVVGGGNSALEEAVSLTNFASKVTIVHQFDHFQAFPAVVDETKANPKINFIMESKIVELKGEESLKTAIIENLKTREKIEMNIDGVFIFIGYMPNTEQLESVFELNENKEIIVDSEMKTNIEGVFAAGDAIAKKFRQITTAVADGTVAALSAAEYLRNKKDEFEKEELLNINYN